MTPRNREALDPPWTTTQLRKKRPCSLCRCIMTASSSGWKPSFWNKPPTGTASAGRTHSVHTSQGEAETARRPHPGFRSIISFTPRAILEVTEQPTWMGKAGLGGWSSRGLRVGLSAGRRVGFLLRSYPLPSGGSPPDRTRGRGQPIPDHVAVTSHSSG